MSVDFSIRDHVATVVLNRPEAMNAIDPETQAALLDCWARIRQDDDVRVVILTGAGERAFCTGADLKKTMPPAESYAALAFGAGDEAFSNQLELDKPIICAINGYALGGGLELALACDIRIAADTARFGLPEVKVGSIPGDGGTQRLPRTMGASDTMLLLLTGDHIDAQEAKRLGLISRIVPPADLLAEAQAIAGRIAANAPLSVRAVKRLVKQGAGLPLDVAIATERLVWGVLRDTRDRIEGRRAFQEKRKPVFTGC
ncbi:enoyl-CoA hydratase/isomerase family protein [Bosea caraganae]|uniref:Enoyl-CoA hydratase/isomerase family protein n=1 Tax=Bosea caraganae TaxID=2763117 RepID=A0A370KXP7_9HYPH|nr:enoyl-CoA hydratase-related protein [Bosea caraganae]RDJ19775.1 enoyl-CoA hydratase/isomerase family protein [Bosea caraganae]RDJ21122.1 enoyl-CoA hydratase/isomerase family protein [Bosea caraganae]